MYLLWLICMHVYPYPSGSPCWHLDNSCAIATVSASAIKQMLQSWRIWVNKPMAKTVCVLYGIFYAMMTSSNGSIFRVTGPLCGEFTGLRWIPRTKASDPELWCFLWSEPNLTAEHTFARLVDLRRYRAHYDVIVMLYHVVYAHSLLFQVASVCICASVSATPLSGKPTVISRVTEPSAPVHVRLVEMNILAEVTMDLLAEMRLDVLAQMRMH